MLRRKCPSHSIKHAIKMQKKKKKKGLPIINHNISLLVSYSSKLSGHCGRFQWPDNAAVGILWIRGSHHWYGPWSRHSVHQSKLAIWSHYCNVYHVSYMYNSTIYWEKVDDSFKMSNKFVGVVPLSTILISYCPMGTCHQYFSNSWHAIALIRQ